MKFFSQLFLVACCLLLAAPVSAAPIVPNSFSTTWKTDNEGSSNDNQITFYLGNGGGSVCTGTIYWEEVGNASNNGTSTLDVGCAEEVITFPTAGTYRLDISGTFPTFRVEDGGEGVDGDKLLSVEQWGNNIWVTTRRMFYRATNFVLNASDVPNLSTVTNTSLMFYNATSFNQNINNWNVSNVTNMQGMFANAIAFNQPLSNWDVSNVITMGAAGTNDGMFSEAAAFNQSINNWDTSAVTSMDYMFAGATAFNQPLDSWDVSNVTNMQAMFYNAPAFNQPLNNWDVINVTDMSLLFFFARAFNQPVSNWSVANVENFSSLFYGATAFNQSLATWDIRNASNIEDILDDTAINATNYAATLTGWAALAGLPSGLTLGNVPSLYCDTAQVARDVIVSNSWIFTDEGAVVCVVEEANTNRSSGTRVGDRARSYFATSTPTSTATTLVIATKESFVEGVRNLIEYLTKNEDELANLSAAESTQLIAALREIVLQLLKFLPGV